MISRNDLISAIDKLQGQKNPTSSSCIKLAAYYIILDHILESDRLLKTKPKSEFLISVRGKSEERVWEIMDGLMELLKKSDPDLYYSTIEEIRDL